MKLNSSGVIVSILILIIMMLLCHAMNFFYPKNKFEDVDTKIINERKKQKNNNNQTKKTDYNQIYYSNESDSSEKKLCNDRDQPEIPCNIIKKCDPIPTPIQKTGLDSLSNSEIAVLYKFAYEASAREILTRTLNDTQPTTTQPTTTQPNLWG